MSAYIGHIFPNYFVLRQGLSYYVSENDLELTT